MENKEFNTLLLKTAFACMACDGEIDQKEVDLIKKLQLEQKIFGDIDIQHDLDFLLSEINENSNLFVKGYFNLLIDSNLPEEKELKIIEVAIATIEADEKIEYSEIKFFKVIRSKLKIENEKILNHYPDMEEYLEQDIISDAYLSRIQDDFFQTQGTFVLNKEDLFSDEK